MIIAGALVTTGTLENLYAVKLGTAGDAYVLLATTAWATTTIAVRKYLRDLDAGVVTLYRYVVASAVFVVYLSIQSSLVLSNIHQILVGIVVGVGTILYYEGLKRLKAAQVSSLELATPFFAALLGFCVFGERVTVMQASGIVLLFAGVCLLSRREDVSCQMCSYVTVGQSAHSPISVNYPHRIYELPVLSRFDNISGRCQPESTDNILLSIGCRENYYGNTPQFFVEFDNLKKFEPVHPGHVQIEKNHAWPDVAHLSHVFESVFAVDFVNQLIGDVEFT